MSKYSKTTAISELHFPIMHLTTELFSYHCIMQRRFGVYLYLLLLISVSIDLYGSTPGLQDFTVKESLSQNGKLAVIALDSLNQTDPTINGAHTFTINGFQQELNFHDGVAITTHPVTTPTFAFLKHHSTVDQTDRIFFLRATDAGLKIYRINSLLLILIPIVVLYIAYKLKRFIITLVIVALVYYYMNQSKGLSLSQLFGNVIDSIKDLF